MLDTVLGGATEPNRRRNVTVVLVSLVFLGAIVIAFTGSAMAGFDTTDGTADVGAGDHGTSMAKIGDVNHDTAVFSAVDRGAVESPTVGPVPHLGYEGNVSIPAIAEEYAEWGIFPTDNTVEVANDTVFVYVTGQDIGGETSWYEFALDGNITGFEFDVRWDPTILELKDIEPTAGAIQVSNEENDDFNYEQESFGFYTVEWDLQLTLWELIGAMFDDDGPDDPFPGFDDDDLFRIEFAPTEMAEPGDFTFISVSHNPVGHGGVCEGITVRGGIPYDLWDITDYNNEDMWCGEGVVEVVPESNEPAIEGAIGSFVATSSGGYISFGEADDPGPDGALAEFPGPDDGGRLIHIEGDYNEDGEWRAKPGDVSFPDIEAGENGVPASVNIDKPIEGTIDVENETMSMDATFEVEVDVLGEDFWFEFNASTGRSGDLLGGADFDVNPETLAGDGTAKLVDNEFVVLEEEQEGLSELPGEAGLEQGGEWVGDVEGMNYITFEWDFTFEEFSGDDSTLVGTVDSGVPIDNASVDVLDQPGREAITDSTGQFEIEGIEPGEWDVRVNAEGYEAVEETIEFEPLETTERVFQLTEGEPNFEVEVTTDDEVTEGTALPVRAVVQNTGDGVDEQEIRLNVDGQTVDAETITLGVEAEDDLTPAPLPHQKTVNLEWEADTTGDVEVEVESDDDSDTVEVTVLDEDDIQIDALLSLESNEGGWISFGEDESDAYDEGLRLPPGGNETEARAGDPILIDGFVSGDTWRSTRVAFPELSVAGFVAEINAPFGFSGEYDPENDRMTIEGALEVVVLDDGDVLGDFAFDVATTTDGSGALDGSASLDDEGGSVVTVDNEYIVLETTGTVLDDVVGLPADTAGENWVELTFDVSAQEVDGDLDFGDIEGVVTDESGSPVSGAEVDLGDGYTTQTDDDGAYALTTVAAGSYEMAVDAEGYGETTVDVVIEAGETTQQDVELAAGEPEFEVSIRGDTVFEGETALIEGTVENVGDGSGTVEVTVSVADESVTESGELEVGESRTIALEWDTEDGDEGEYTVEIETADDSATDDVVVMEAIDEDEIGADAMFTATSVGGWISFTEETEAVAQEEGLALPAAGEDAEYIEIQGLIEDGEWQSMSVQFPELEVPDMGLTAKVSVPRGLHGEIDPEEGHMTIEGEFEVEVVGASGSFSFEIGATTGDSGALSGEATPDRMTLVDNEYIIPEGSGDALIDGALNLPATDPGENWFELDVELEVEELEGPIGDDTGTLEGVVESAGGDAIEGATVDVVGTVETATTGADGSYEIDVAAGSYDLEVDASGYEPETVTVVVRADETARQDVSLQPGEPAFETSVFTDDAGDTVEVIGEVTNTGTAAGTESVTLEVGDELVEEGVTLAPGESEMLVLELEVDANEAEGMEAVMAVGEETTSIALTLDEDDDAEGSGNTFTIESTGGWIYFDESDQDQAREDALQFPPTEDDDRTIFIAGEIHDDGTWESTSTNFPSLQVPDTSIFADVEAPNGLGGEIDPETGHMTLEGTLEVDVQESDGSFSFEISATVGDSGALSGSADFDEDGGSVTLVDNELIIDEESGDPLIDGVVGLPVTESGKNWFVLDADIELDADADEAAERAEEGEDDDEEDGAPGGSFVASFGQLVGLLGLAASTVLVFGGMAARFISAVDPDPES